LNSGNPGSSHNSAIILDDSSPSNFDADAHGNNELNQINFPRVNIAQNQHNKTRGGKANRMKPNMLYRIEEKKEEQAADNADSLQAKDGAGQSKGAKDTSDKLREAAILVQDSYGSQ